MLFPYVRETETTSEFSYVYDCAVNTLIKANI